MANPIALLISGVLMLRHLDKNDVADRIMEAIRRPLADGVKTGVLGGNASTSEHTEAVGSRLD